MPKSVKIYGTFHLKLLELIERRVHGLLGGKAEQKLVFYCPTKKTVDNAVARGRFCI